MFTTIDQVYSIEESKSLAIADVPHKSVSAVPPVHSHHELGDCMWASLSLLRELLRKERFFILCDEVNLANAKYFGLFDQKSETIRNNCGWQSISPQTGTFDHTRVKIKVATSDNRNLRDTRVLSTFLGQSPKSQSLRNKTTPKKG